MDSKVREQVSKEMQELIQMGLIEVKSVAADGNFCYGCTEDGQKIAKGEANMQNETKEMI